MFDSRLAHLVKKEFIQLMRDKRMIGAVIIAPIIQLIVFGYVATLDVRDIPAVLFDQNKTYISRDFVSSFKNSGYFSIKYTANSIYEEKRLLDGGKVQVAINIPPDYSKKIISNDIAEIQFIVDGTNSNSAGIALGYINGIVFQNSIKILKEKYGNIKDIEKKINIINAKERVFHNQGLKSVNYMVPGVIAFILMILTSLLTAASIVKEKEYGTMEQLIVTPIKPYELMIGKMAPFVLLAFIDVFLVFLVATLWFKVPVLGNIWLLFGLCAIFLVTSLGLGLYISTISATMQQTILSLIFIILPSIMLSGFIFPIPNMPEIIQFLTYIIPLRYFMVIVRGIFLKGVGIEYLWGETLALLVLGGLIFYMAVRKFKKKLS